MSTVATERTFSTTELLRKAAEEGTLSPAAIEYLGLGANVFAPSPIEGLKHSLAIFDFAKAGTKVIDIDKGLRVEIPTIVNLLPTPAYHSVAGSTTAKTATSKSVSVSVGVEAGYNMFSAGVNAKFSASNNQAEAAYYTSLTEHISFADIMLNTTESKYFTQDFANDLAALPADCEGDNMEAYSRFFEKWGLYYLSHASLGGDLNAFNAVRFNQSTTEMSCEADIKAQFNGLFYSGGFSSSVTGSGSWSNFTENSSLEFYITGGSPAAQGAVVNVNTLSPSGQTVNAHQDWLESLPLFPSTTNMYFDPIWRLAGEKQTTMEVAAAKYVTAINFNTHMVYGDSPRMWTGNTTITINNHYYAPENLDACGVQAVVIKRTNPAEVVNKFFSYDYNNWQNTAPKMWDDLYAFLQEYGSDYTIGLATQNMNAGACPTEAMQSYLSNVLGVEKVLSKWAGSANRTSDDGRIYCTFNVVSTPEIGFNNGAAYYYSPWWRDPKNITLATGATVLLNANGSASIESNM